MIVNVFFGQDSQQTNTKIKYVYSETTTNSYKEICNLLKDDTEALKKALKNYYKLIEQGKVILSTNEYAPISEKISEYKLNPSINMENKTYAQIALNKYVLVTEIINK
jgi:hypothetical protein